MNKVQNRQIPMVSTMSGMRSHHHMDVFTIIVLKTSLSLVTAISAQNTTAYNSRQTVYEAGLSSLLFFPCMTGVLKAL